jgi:glucose/arabinose dehydrogenase
MRFDISNIPNGGINWNNGDLFADGLRNEAGLRVDANQQLWGVENGIDDLYRSDLGGDIHQNNPSEEMNFFGSLNGEKKSPEAAISGFYGYPYCWSQYALNVTTPRGTQYVRNINSICCN